MKALLLLFVTISSAALLQAGEVVINPTAMSERAISSQKLWRVSIAAVATANAIDIHSSWGKRELNPVLAGTSGSFGGRGALIKLGLQGGWIGIEYLITRRHRSGKVFRALSAINFGASAALAGVAIRNYTIPRPQ
jgi:hypothetical protein